MARGVYAKYRRVLEELGLKQLDVYRLKDKEVLRILMPDGRVKMLELPRRRESMNVDEFKEYIVSTLKK